MTPDEFLKAHGRQESYPPKQEHQSKPNGSDREEPDMVSGALLVARLVGLTLPEYDRVREAEAAGAGMRVETLDDLVTRARRASRRAEPPPTAKLHIINPADLELEPVPQREWIVQDWLPIGAVTALYGDGGTGKTLLAQQLMTACATVTPWCGLAVTRCRAIGLFCEDSEAELHIRQVRICQHLGIRLGSLGEMRWISGLGEDNTLASFANDGRMHATERYDALEKAAKDFGARLVVLDTAADTFGGNENDRGQVRKFIGLLNRLALEINGAVLLNAHPSRDGLKTGNLDGGSTAWSNSVRSRWSLARPGQDDTAEQQDTAERVLTRRKANYASTGDTIKLRWVLGAFAPMTTEGGISGTIQRAAVESVFLDLLDRCNEQQFRVSNSRNAGNYAPRVFARRPDADGYSAKEFERAMARLFTDRRIRLAVYGRSGDARQQIVREPGPAEGATP
jgi:RecA-family ATPase